MESVPLAKSAPKGKQRGQSYRNHVFHVWRWALMFATAMRDYAPKEWASVIEAIKIAAYYHDLGKLDPLIQRVFVQGSGALVVDHVDAGVAHLLNHENFMGAWLVRSHHGPGLPSKSKHFGVVDAMRLRGGRHATHKDEKWKWQCSRTDEFLDRYLAIHQSVLGKYPVQAYKARHGLCMRLALSCLVDADHSASAHFDSGWRRPRKIEPRWLERLECLDKYVAALGGDDSDRNRERADFYRDCREYKTDQRIVSCEGPVGIGKTTAVLAYLLKRAHEENLRHIIIVAPYTNILSQTAGMVREAIVLDGEQADEVVVEHHHRAEFESEAARSLSTLWSAPIVLTTAVQFFETLAACHPTQLRKLLELPGSAIFIDESHAALPVRLWPQNWKWLCELADQWRCTFVLASGSQARFWMHEQIVSKCVRHLPEMLLPELAERTRRTEQRRVSFRNLHNVGGLDALVEKVPEQPGPRLVIMNTVQSAAVVAHWLRNDGKACLHLSTALCPADREKIIKRIKERLKDRTDTDWTLVATSCVEAGVDLSFRTAFREAFSVASLIQTSGRVNRHCEYNDDGGGMLFSFVIERGNGISHHPEAKISAQFVAELRDNTDFADPGTLVTKTMIRELMAHGGIAHDRLREAEAQKDYPKVAENGRVITTDTRTVVVEKRLIKRLEEGEHVSSREIMQGSVQLWSNKIEKLGMVSLPGRSDLYVWKDKYSRFLGIMAGILRTEAFWTEDCGIL